MAEYNEQFATKNIALTDLSQITKVQVGYDTDGNFKDVFISGEYLDLTNNRSIEATYSSTNTVLTRINIIKIVGKIHLDEEDTVLAYRPLGYTLDITPSEDAQITVQVTLFTTVDGLQEGTIELNYLEHSQVANPQTVHENIENLPYQSSISNIASSNFPCIIDNRGESSFDDDSTDVQRKNNTPVYFSGRGHTYSNLLWYYWNPDNISHFLYVLSNKFNEDGQHGALADYTSNLISEFYSQKPFLGFNARYGSYLYWYDISDDYICVIYVGSNHYNAVDIFIVPNSVNIAPKQHQFFDNNNREFRIKFNRWYNHLYFIADNKAYQINTNLENGHAVYAQEIRESFDYVDSNDGSDELVYKIRAFQTEQADAIQIVPLFNDDDNSTKYYQLEFSDIGDVIIGSFEDSDGQNQTKLFIRNIFEIGSGYSWSFDDPIDATDMYDTTDNNVLFNIFAIDNPQQDYRLMGLYQTTLVHLQYFLQNQYTPIYLGEEYSIGWSEVYQNYLTLFKTPTMLARRRTAADWLNDTISIEQGKIKHYYGLVENIYTGETFMDTENTFSQERGVCVKADIIGAHRNINTSAKIFTYTSWTRPNQSSIRTAYDYDNYNEFYPLLEPEDIKLNFKDSNGNITTFNTNNLSSASYYFDLPSDGVFSSMRLVVNTNYSDIYLTFTISSAFRNHFPLSSEFANKYWNDDYTIKDGCSISIEKQLATKIPIYNWSYQVSWNIIGHIDNTYYQYLTDYPSYSAYSLMFKNTTEQLVLYAATRKNYNSNSYCYFFEEILEENYIEIILTPLDSSDIGILIAAHENPEQSQFLQKFFDIDIENQTCSLKTDCSVTLVRSAI